MKKTDARGAAWSQDREGMMLRLTSAGEKQTPRKPHNVAAWGGIRELLRSNGGAATREQILKVLEYCWHPNRRLQPNTKYLDYAVKEGWLAEG